MVIAALPCRARYRTRLTGLVTCLWLARGETSTRQSPFLLTNLSPPLPPRLDSPHPSSMRTRAADRRYRLGCEPTDKPASIGRPGLSAKQPERMLLQVVKCRPAEQGNGNEFGRERRRAKDGRQCRL